MRRLRDFSWPADSSGQTVEDRYAGKMKNILKEEFIGRDIEVTQAANSSLVGLKGKVTNETRNMFVISTPDGEKKVLKMQVTLKVKYRGKLLEIDGKKLIGRPWERLKR